MGDDTALMSARSVRRRPCGRCSRSSRRSSGCTSASALSALRRPTDRSSTITAPRPIGRHEQARHLRNQQTICTTPVGGPAPARARRELRATAWCAFSVTAPAMSQLLGMATGCVPRNHLPRGLDRWPWLGDLAEGQAAGVAARRHNRTSRQSKQALVQGLKARVGASPLESPPGAVHGSATRSSGSTTSAALDYRRDAAGAIGRQRQGARLVTEGAVMGALNPGCAPRPRPSRSSPGSMVQPYITVIENSGSSAGSSSLRAHSERSDVPAGTGSVGTARFRLPPDDAE